MKPAPLTPPDCDLRDFSWMPLDVTRLRDSDLIVLLSPEAFRAAVMLWCASWHQLPAASLPIDDRILAKLAGYGRDVESWAKVRDDALRGFIECSDGRLYHPVVAVKALEANEQRKRQRERTQKATEARRGTKRSAECDDSCNVGRDDKRDDCKPSNRDGSRNEVQQTRPDKDRDRNKKESEPSNESLERVAPIVADEPAPSKSETLSPDLPASPERPWRSAPRATAGLAALGTQLPTDWTPDVATCEACKVDFGMTDDDLRTELPAFHAYNVQNATFSADWNKTFYLFCKRWKEHRDKQAPPRVQPNKQAAAAPRQPEDLTEADWDREVGFYARTGRWTRGIGPDPLHRSGCKAPRHILERHGIHPETGERPIPPRKAVSA